MGPAAWAAARMARSTVEVMNAPQPICIARTYAELADGLALRIAQLKAEAGNAAARRAVHRAVGYMGKKILHGERPTPA